MSTMETHDWQQAVLTEHAVYPGHPLITATMIMDRYHDLAHANGRPADKDFSNALADNFIPGAGCAVSSALRVLQVALGEGGVPMAKKVAEDYWDGWERQNEKNKASAAIGRHQAERILPHFVARLEAWKAGRPLPSDYRLPVTEALPA